MRPVARIAQSVEQGIENPRVLGSIPSPGTTYSENPAYGWVFAFLRPDSPSNVVPFAANITALKLMNDLLQNAHVRLVQYPFIPTHF